MKIATREKNIEMLTLALTLAITAPSDEKADECIEIADSIAANLKPAEVAQCQRAAQRNTGLPEDPVLVEVIDNK